MKTDSTKLLPVVEQVLSTYKTWYSYRHHLPKQARHTLGDRIDQRFIQVLELLQTAAYETKAEKLPTLEKALLGIDMIKFLLQTAWEIGIFDNKKYADLSQRLNESGRQVGGWVRGLQTKTPPK